MKTTREMIEVMEAYERGEEVEIRLSGNNQWTPRASNIWDWAACDYRIVPQPAPIPITLDWSALKPEWRWVAADADEFVFLYKSKPVLDLDDGCWVAHSGEDTAQGDTLASFSRGTVPWDKSLIERPEGV